MLQSPKLSFSAKSLPWGLTATCESPPMELSWAQTNFKARYRFCAWIRTLNSQKNTQMKDSTHLARGPPSGRKQWGCPQGHWGPSLGDSPEPVPVATLLWPWVWTPSSGWNYLWLFGDNPEEWHQDNWVNVCRLSLGKKGEHFVWILLNYLKLLFIK